MEVKVHYNNLNERAALIKQYESQKLTMLHDDFDPDWESGDEPHGTMTFTDTVQLPTDIPSPIEFIPDESTDVIKRLIAIEEFLVKLYPRRV